MSNSAYLITVCDAETNKILEASIWSSPEWEASRQLPGCRTYVAYMVKGNSFQDALIHLLKTITDIRSRYNYLVKYLDPNRFVGFKDPETEEPFKVGHPLGHRKSNQITASTARKRVLGTEEQELDVIMHDIYAQIHEAVDKKETHIIIGGIASPEVLHVLESAPNFFRVGGEHNFGHARSTTKIAW